jgi:hypothetical protein
MTIITLTDMCWLAVTVVVIQINRQAGQVDLQQHVQAAAAALLDVSEAPSHPSFPLAPSQQRRGRQKRHVTWQQTAEARQQRDHCAAAASPPSPSK